MPRVISNSWTALAVLLALGACSKPQPKGPMGPPEVGYVVVQPQSATLETELPGRTSAIETSDVRPQVNGLIQNVAFTQGSVVKRGQVLYQIDPAPYRAALAQAQGALANAKAAVVTAKLKSDRYAELVKIDAVSKQDYDDAKAAYGQAAATVQQDEAAVQAARINLDYTRVTAPISGRIGRTTVTRGALVTASQTTALDTIQRMDAMYVDVSQSSAEMLKLQRGLQSGALSKGGVSVRLRLEDGSLYDTPGVLQFADVTVDQNTGAVTLRATFPNPRNILLPGMYVTAIVIEGVQANAILAPQTGVTRDERGLPVAMVVDANNKAQQRTLKTGQAIGDKWLVLDGLQAGDKLITEGTMNAKPGQPVHPVPAGSPPAHGPPPGARGGAPQGTSQGGM